MGISALMLFMPFFLSDRNEQRSSICEKYKPFFVSEDELGALLEEASGGFIFVSNTERLQLLHISDTVEKHLKISPVCLITISKFFSIGTDDGSMTDDYD